MRELSLLHQQITREIIEERNREVAESIAAKREQSRKAEEAYQSQVQSIEQAGIKFSNFSSLEVEDSRRAEEHIKSIETRMNELSQQAAVSTAGPDVEKVFLPEGARVLTPAWVASFQDDDVQDKLTESTSISARDLLSGGSCQDFYNWAAGSGSGIAGTGVGEIQSWINFGFWFRPPTSKFYSINPLFRYRGYYIVTADDKWYNSKYARVVVSAWTNVHQYNWKGWNSINVLDVGGDNIDVNRRFDNDRYTYNSYLLGGGDWAWISCVIGLYAYARGGGSYAKNDFATGAANYLCVPHCYVY
jgi:hypothetical protein